MIVVLQFDNGFVSACMPACKISSPDHRSFGFAWVDHPGAQFAYHSGQRRSTFAWDGSIVIPLIGCIVLGTLRNGFILLNVQVYYQLLATGIIIIVAILIDKPTGGKQGG